MSTRIGTAHFQDWDDAFRYYARQDYSRQDVIDLIANGVIAIGPPDNAEGLRLILDDDGRYFYEITPPCGVSISVEDAPLVTGADLLAINVAVISAAYGKSSHIVDTDEPPQWFKDYMNEHKHLFRKGWKDESDANSTE